MYKVAILGCENSHAKNFLDAVLNHSLVDDIEFVGVYSADREAAEALHEKFGVYVANSYDEFAGKVDGIMITARHGDDHYKFAKPYIESGIPIFIDKPITCSEEDAFAFMTELKTHQVPVSGGSMCKYAEYVQALKRMAQNEEYGRVYGGVLRAPVNIHNPYGDFFFYSQHLVQVMQEIFGAFPKSVIAVEKQGIISGIVRYEEYDIHVIYADKNLQYYAGISCEKGIVGNMYELTGASDKELLEYHRLLCGEKMRESYEEFFAPVYILNAFNKAINQGGEIQIEWPGR